MNSEFSAEQIAPPCWYAVYVWARHERRTATHLLRKGIEVFLPQYRAVHQWKNRVKAEVELPLFPSYLFVRIPLTERWRVLEAPGALSLVGSPGAPSPVAVEEIERLRQAVKALKCEPHPYLKVGDRVRVVAGPLRDSEGVLVRFQQGYRVVLSLDLIMSSISVQIDLNEIERIREACPAKHEPHAGLTGAKIINAC